MHYKLRELFIEVSIFTNNNMTGQIDSRPLQPSPKVPILPAPYELFLSTSAGRNPYQPISPLFIVFFEYRSYTSYQPYATPPPPPPVCASSSRLS